MKTSILERLTGSLCDIVTGRNDGQVMLEMLDRANLFVIPLDEDRAWYRFHRLFRDVLSARLQQRDPNSVPELHRRAADWCAEHGLIDEAIRHALAGGLATTAAQHVENNLSRAFNRGEGATVVRWLSLLPDELVSARPRLGIAAAMMAWHVYRLDGMDRSLRDVESAAEQVDGDDGFEVPTEGGVVGDIGAATALLRAQSVLVNGRTAEARTYLDQARQRMRDNELGPRFFADWLQGAADWVDGDMEAAEPHFARMLDKGRATPSPHPLMISCSPLGHIREARGDLDGAVRTYRVSLRLAQEARRPSPFHLAEAHLGMARVLYQRGELDSALRHATEGLDLARQVVEYLLLGTGLQTLAWIRNAMGDDDMARAAVDESIQLIPEPGVASFFYPGHAGRVKLLLAQGDVRQAQEWIGERRLSIRDEVTYNSQRSHVLLARVLIAEASHDDAIGVLERLKELAQRQGRNGDLVEIECLMARASEAAGDQEAALSRLAETLTRASPQRYIRVFVNEGAAMSRLLRLLTASESGQIARVPANVRGHIARIQRAFGPPGSSGEVPVTDMIAPLTSRELDVLQLLAAGRRNREIADELYVALDTVKKHVSHILEKLAAGTRTEAVAEAARLGLLDGPRRSQD